MTTWEDTNWLEDYLGVDIRAEETQIQDLLVLLAKKVENLELELKNKNKK